MEIERISELEEVQGEDEKRISPCPWTSHMRIRGLITSVFIGIIFSVIVTKLNLTIGIAPNFNVSAAFVAFVLIRTWTNLIHSSPFTPQENTIIQTCGVACYSIASGGYNLNSFCFFFNYISSNMCSIVFESKFVVTFPVSSSVTPYVLLFFTVIK